MNLYLAGPPCVSGALKNHSLDALLVPTEFSPNFPALIGSPVVTVPLCVNNSSTEVVKNGSGILNVIVPNLPLDISFLRPKWSEEYHHSLHPTEN
jgi:amidase